MDAFNPWGLMAAAFALVSGYAIGSLASNSLRRRRSAASIIALDGETRASALLRGGVPVFEPLARRLLAHGKIAALAEELREEVAARGWRASEEAIVTLVIAALLATGVCAGIASRSVACALAVGCCFCLGVASFARMRAERRLAEVREAVPDALRSMSSCFRSGYSLSQTLGQLSEDAPGCLGEAFGKAARRLELGEPSANALAALSDLKGVDELRFVSVALDVQHQAGGAIAPVLDAARESVEGELDLARTLRVQTAQAKLSAQVVTAMPFVLVALFSLMSPGFLAPFFASAAGIGLLLTALGMQLSGVLIVRRMLRVETG